MRFSTLRSMIFFMRCLLRVLTIFRATSVRSLIIESTSFPWNPTSVNLVASTLMKGACANLASLRAISVFPTPVGPIISIFLGIISSLMFWGSFLRLQRFRKASATAFLASPCPTMKRSSSFTISLGVIWEANCSSSINSSTSDSDSSASLGSTAAGSAPASPFTTSTGEPPSVPPTPSDPPSLLLFEASKSNATDGMLTPKGRLKDSC
mmetsp:Transcript_12362/g.17625  ORF Transcript_12362/g.17625 Transcript_12362/m.17625 type:complete len:209 (+) Transcript_12362:211-837(+)